MQLNNRVRGQRRNPNGRSSGTPQPAPLQASIQVDKVIRFKFSAALASVAVTDTDLIDLLCMATAANAAYGLAKAYKLRAIEMWADPVAGGSLISIEDRAVSSDFGTTSRLREDTTLGTARPAHLKWSPAPMSLNATWQLGINGQPRFILVSSGAGYLDLHYSIVLQDGDTPVAVGAAVAGATTGKVYIRSLNSSSGTNLVPVSFPTI